MADDKKDKKPPPSPSPAMADTPWEFLFLAGIAALIIGYILTRLTAFINGNAFLGSLNTREAYEWFWDILPFLQIFSFNLIYDFILLGIILSSY